MQASKSLKTLTCFKNLRSWLTTTTRDIYFKSLPNLLRIDLRCSLKLFRDTTTRASVLETLRVCSNLLKWSKQEEAIFDLIQTLTSIFHI